MYSVPIRAGAGLSRLKLMETKFCMNASTHVFAQWKENFMCAKLTAVALIINHTEGGSKSCATEYRAVKNLD